MQECPEARSSLSSCCWCSGRASPPQPPSPLDRWRRRRARAGIEVGAAVDANLSDERPRHRRPRVHLGHEWENSAQVDPLVVRARRLRTSRPPTPPSTGQRPTGCAFAATPSSGTGWNGTPSWLPRRDCRGAGPGGAAHRADAGARRDGRRPARRGRIAQWDVVNEPLALGGRALDSASVYFQTLGESYLDIAFEAADRADPDALLFLNETLTDAPPVFEGLLDLLDGLLDRGVPIDGVGLQSHYVLVPPLATNLQSQIQQIADLGPAGGADRARHSGVALRFEPRTRSPPRRRPTPRSSPPARRWSAAPASPPGASTTPTPGSTSST